MENKPACGTPVGRCACGEWHDDLEEGAYLIRHFRAELHRLERIIKDSDLPIKINWP